MMLSVAINFMGFLNLLIILVLVAVVVTMEVVEVVVVILILMEKEDVVTSILVELTTFKFRRVTFLMNIIHR